MNNDNEAKLVERNEFESKLAVFVGFVEEEAARIDEEKRGLRRRDGSRKMQCALFLKQLLPKSPDEDLSRAIKALAKIVETDHVTDDMRSMASKLLEGKHSFDREQQIEHIKEENYKLSEALRAERARMREGIEKLKQSRILIIESNAGGKRKTEGYHQGLRDAAKIISTPLLEQENKNI